MKSICMFCGRSHKTKPKLCQAKGDVIRAYASKLPKSDFWKVMHAVETGLIDLDGEAVRLVNARRAKA